MDLFLGVGSTLVLVAILSTRLAQRFGMPALILFVLIGMLAGSSGPGGIAFDDYALAYEVGLLALAVILFSGGLDTRYRLFRAALLPAGLLATAGVALTMLVVGFFAWALTPLGWLEGLLLGAILAPTDAAAVFSVLKGRGLPARLRGILETESGTNDPVGIYLTVALTTLLSTGQTDIWALLLGIVTQLSLGGLLGFLLGRVLVWLINRVQLDTYGLYPLLALAGGLFSYAATNLLGGNGFLAVYVVGLVLANRPLSQRRSIMEFMDGAAWGAQVSMFLLLGLLVFPDRLPSILPLALLLTAVLIFVARPLAVWLTLLPLYQLTHHYRFSWQEQLLLMWAGLKGAVPIILATVPLLNQVPGGERLFNIVFVVVIVGTTLQGMTVVPWARFLGLTHPEPPAAPLRLELDGETPPGSAVHDLFLGAQHRLVGRALADLSLPEGVVVAAVYRDGKLVAPWGGAVLKAGDHVYFLSSGENVRLTATASSLRDAVDGQSGVG